MDKDTRNYLEILMTQVDAFGVRIRKLEEADPGPWLAALDRRVGALEAGCTMPHEPDGELVVKVIHRLPGEGEKP